MASRWRTAVVSAVAVVTVASGVGMSLAGGAAAKPLTTQAQRGVDGYGMVRWSTLSWWPHPFWDRKPYDNRESEAS